MRYPYQNYLKSLLAQQKDAFDIAACCEARFLTPPAEEDLEELERELLPYPPGIENVEGRPNARVWRWAREQGLLAVWKNKDLTEQAEDFLFSGHIREDFEALLLTMGNVTDARNQMLLKYSERRVPSLAVLEHYEFLYWDILSMTSRQVFDFLSLQSNETRLVLQPAFNGDKSTVFGKLGYSKTVSDVDLLDEFIALAHRQVNLARQATDLLTGSAMAGLGVLMKQATEAMETKKELRAIGGTDDDIRKAATEFKLKRLKVDGPTQFRTLDDIRRQEEEESVLDVPFEEIDNVRAFKPNRNK
jgi:hypothetical protein